MTQGCLLLQVIHIMLEILASVTKQEKEVKGTQNRKKIK